MSQFVNTTSPKENVNKDDKLPSSELNTTSDCNDRVLPQFSTHIMEEISKDPRIIYYDQQIAYHRECISKFPPPKLPNFCKNNI